MDAGDLPPHRDDGRGKIARGGVRVEDYLGDVERLGFIGEVDRMNAA
jgi:hypothetical protein